MSSPYNKTFKTPQVCGVFLGALEFSYIKISDCNFEGLSGTAIENNATNMAAGNVVFRNNFGFNPQGPGSYLTGFSGSGSTATNIAGSDIQVYISGGTLTEPILRKRAKYKDNDHAGDICGSPWGNCDT